MTELGVGVVGCGRNGFRHAELYNSMEEVELLGVCDIARDKAESAANKLGVKAFTRIEDLLAENGVEAVSVANSGSHSEPAVAAAKAGVHVLVEVAFAPTLQECDQMIAAAEGSGVNMMFAQTHRFYPFNAVAKSLIDRGEIGDPIWVTRTILRSGQPTSEAWHRWRSSGGGYFMYEGPHSIDQFKWLVGSDIETVYTVGMGRYASGGDGEDNGIAGFKFKNGSFGALLKGTASPGAPHNHWNVIGTKGILNVVGRELRLGQGAWASVPYPHKGDPPVTGFESFTEATHYQGFLAEFREFVGSIRQGRQPSVTAYDGRAATEAALAIRRSRETGEPVNLPLSSGDLPQSARRSQR
jgi:predicted dehydrogenase